MNMYNDGGHKLVDMVGGLADDRDTQLANAYVDRVAPRTMWLLDDPDAKLVFASLNAAYAPFSVGKLLGMPKKNMQEVLAAGEDMDKVRAAWEAYTNEVMKNMK